MNTSLIQSAHRDDSCEKAEDCCVTDRRILFAEKFAKIPYGSSNLRDSGCAVFVIAHANPRWQNNVEILARVFTDQGYVQTDSDGHCKGTWHHLFDRLGATRLDNFSQVFENLKSGHIVTVLTAGHFRNIVGVDRNCFLVEDSKFHDRQKVSFQEITETLRAAWVW